MRVYKLLTLFSIVAAFVYGTQVGIELKFPSLPVLKDSHGSELPTVQVGEQFIVELNVLAKEGQNILVESIEGLEKLQVLSKESSYELKLGTHYNSESTITQYTVKALHKGTFKLGPIKIKCDGKGYISGTYYYNVVEQPAPGSAASQHLQSRGGVASYAARQGNKPFIHCQVVAPQTTVYLGQQFELSLLVYMHGMIVDHAPKAKEFPGFSSTFAGALPPREERHGEKTLEVREYKFLLTPLKTGNLEIGPCEVVYVAPVVSMFHGFGLNLGHREERLLTSNTCSVTVETLPTHKGRVDGIGVFTHFEAFIDKHECVANEPLKVTFTLEGSGNFENITDLKLLLPAAYRSYKSKAEMLQTVQGGKNRKKAFDYIVQIPTYGPCVIPEQKFVYFDTQDKKYKTLVSRPIELNVQQDPHQQSKQNSDNYDKDKLTNKNNDAVSKKTVSVDEIAYIEEGGNFGKPKPYAFPWWVMLLILCMPLVFSHQKLVGLVKKIRGLTISEDKAWLAHIKTKQRLLDDILRQQKASALYQYFDKLCKELFVIESHQAVEKELENKLLRLDWDEVKIQQFFEYLSMCASLHFVAKAAEQELLSKKALEKSNYWFALLTAKKMQNERKDSE